MRLPWLLLVFVVLSPWLPTVTAQDQVNPHSRLALEDLGPTSSGTASVKVILELGLLQCQDDFEAMVDLAVQAEPGNPSGLTIIMPTTVTVSFDSATFALAYPYNYGGDVQVPVEVRSERRLSEDLVVRLNVTASYPGGDVANCASTGPMPPAATQATMSVPLVAPPVNSTAPPVASAAEPKDGGIEDRDSPVAGAAVLGVLVLGAGAAARRRRKRQGFHRKER